MKCLLAGSFGQYLSDLYNDAFGGSMSDAVTEALEPETVNFLGIDVNPSYFTALGVTIFLLLIAVVIRIFVIPKFKKQPTGFQIMLEKLVTYFDDTAADTGKSASFVGPYIFTAASFIAIGTLVELLGVRPAFADINTCFAFGLTTFVYINICGFQQKGLLGRTKHYLNPINIVTDLSVPLSLSLRLFGSIMSGFIIMEVVYNFIYTSFVLPVIVSVITTLFHAAIQSFLFATLTTVFIREAVE